MNFTNKLLVFFSMVATILLASVGASSASESVHGGRVTKVLKADGFTYVKCVKDGGAKWVALAGNHPLVSGDVVEYSEVAPLPNAESRLQGMTFKEVEFAPEPKIYRNGTMVFPKGDLPAAHAATAGDIAPVSREEFGKLIAQSIEDPVLFNNPFREGSEVREIYARFAHDLLNDKTIVDYFYREFVSSYGRVSDYRGFGRSMAADIIFHGALRLSDADFEDLLRITNKIRTKLPAKESAQVVRDKLKFDIKWLELLSNEDASRYFALTKKAFIGQITNAPILPNNTEDESHAGLQALQGEIARRLSQEELLRYQRISSQLEMSENDEIKWCFDVMMDALFNLPEQPRRWMIREFTKTLRSGKE